MTEVDALCEGQIVSKDLMGVACQHCLARHRVACTDVFTHLVRLCFENEV
jgi:hypothetical protein